MSHFAFNEITLSPTCSLDLDDWLNYFYGSTYFESVPYDPTDLE